LERKTPSSATLANVKVYFVLLAMVTVVFCGVVVGAHYSQPLHNNVNVISVGAAKQRQHKLIAVICQHFDVNKLNVSGFKASLLNTDMSNTMNIHAIEMHHNTPARSKID
jgi:hypothetical protein